MTGSAPDADFGGRLRQARERRGISLRQIATSTKISVGVLEALERNDFSKLPGGIFGRAFVRSYAHEVGLDPEATVLEFLASLPSESPAAGLHVPPRHVDREESLFESQQRMAGVALKLVLVSVPIAALLLYFTIGRGGPSTPSPGSTKMPAPATQQRGPRGQPPETPVRTPAVQPPPAVAVSGDSRAAVPAPAPEEAGLVLEVSPTGSCWVSLTVDGNLILSRVMEPGERVARRVREGALVQIGDAGAFAFTINGREARSLGARGEVKSIQITRDNYQSYLR